MPTIDVAFIAAVVAILSTLGTLGINALTGRHKAQIEDETAKADAVKAKAQDSTTVIDGYAKLCGTLQDRMERVDMRMKELEGRNQQQGIDAERLASDLKQHTAVLAEDVRIRALRITELERHSAAMQDEMDTTRAELEERDARIAELEKRVSDLRTENESAQHDLRALRDENAELKCQLEALKRVAT